MKTSILNIIVCGTGGRGVQTLSNLIRKLANKSGYRCEGATFKGGAQKMGTVYSELRMVRSEAPIIISSQIPKGEAHLLIALEPWEALRFAHYCSRLTKVIVNTDVELLFVERYFTKPIEHPVDQLKELFYEPILKNYSILSQELTSSKKSANILILQDAIQNQLLPFSLEDIEALNEYYE